MTDIKTREEVARFIEKQLHYKYDCTLPKPYTYHYGRQELKELMDFIYNDPPKTTEEQIRKECFE